MTGPNANGFASQWNIGLNFGICDIGAYGSFGGVGSHIDDHMHHPYI